MQQQYSTVNYGGANSGQGASLKVKLSQLEVSKDLDTHVCICIIGNC